MRNTLKDYITKYEELVNKNARLENQAEAQKQQFVSERHAGKKGKLPSTLFPTIQDLTIYLFYGSVFVLFFMMGSTNSILSTTSPDGVVSNMPKYVFIAGSIATFMTQFYSIQFAFVLLVILIIYFITAGYKSFAFFIAFLITLALIAITINSSM